MSIFEYLFNLIANIVLLVIAILGLSGVINLKILAIILCVTSGVTLISTLLAGALMLINNKLNELKKELKQ